MASESDVLHNAPITGALDLAATQPCPEAGTDIVSTTANNNELAYVFDSLMSVHPWNERR